jgi:putative membrane protein
MITIGNSRQTQRNNRVTTGTRITEPILLKNLEAIAHNISAKGRGNTVTSSTQSDRRSGAGVYSLMNSRNQLMQKLASVLIAFVALEHLGFLVLEMFLWTSPTGMQVFGLTQELAEQTSALAANQGLYNGFLAAGLIWSLVKKNDAFSLQVFFLSCVVIAGIPAMIALVFVVLTNRRTKVTSTVGG